jgi:hypothetical protein
MHQTKIVEKIETRILCSITSPLLPGNRTICEIIWKNTVQTDRPHIAIWRMRMACWIPKATNTHSEYVILIAFSLQQWFARTYIVLLYSALCVDKCKFKLDFCL